MQFVKMESRFLSFDNMRIGLSVIVRAMTFNTTFTRKHETRIVSERNLRQRRGLHAKENVKCEVQWSDL